MDGKNDMNVLFMTISGMPQYNRHDIYADVLYALQEKGHHIYAISSDQKRNGNPTSYLTENGIHALRVRTGNITKCGAIEKGISTLQIKCQYVNAIKKYLKGIKFDLVLYATPPITLASVVGYIKKRDNAKTYLMLKDIFPQNAVDLGMMSKKGIKGLIYKYFRAEEKKLYAVSDRIGGMSPANVSYVIQENPEIEKSKVEVFPNCLAPLDLRVNNDVKHMIREKYNIPLNKTVFVYGGNLGKPQGVPFIIDSIRKAAKENNTFFLIVGSGTEYRKIEAFIENEKPENVQLMKKIPKEDYDQLVAACDVGLIYLDYRFTIPNFPSRLLSYLQAGLPVLCATDPNTDIGKIATENGFGWSCISNNVDEFVNILKTCLNSDLQAMGTKGYEYLQKNFDINVGLNRLVSIMEENK